MPHPLDDDTAAALHAIRREALQVKIDAAPSEHGAPSGPLYRLATQIGLLTDLVEYLLLREHTHSGTPPESQRFGG